MLKNCGPSASARSRRLQTPGRVSPRLGGARLGPGWGPSCPCGVAPSGARSPAPDLRHPAWPDRVPASFWFTRSERQRLHASSRGAPLGTVRLRTATRTKACDPSATASALPLGRPPPQKGTSRLRCGHRSPHAPGPSRRDSAPAPGYGRRPGFGSVGVRSWRPGRCQRPCHRALCMLTRRGCPILYVPAQCAPAKTEALLPKMGMEERGLLLLPSRFREGRSVGRAGWRAAPAPGSRLGTAHLRTGGEEECTGTADTNPGCNYLVRGYSPSMHYFWRGDMPHFSSPLPFQRGARGCQAAAVPQPPPAGAPSTSAGQIGAPAGAGLRRSPDPRGWRAVDLGRPERGSRGRGPRRSPDPRGRRGRARPPFRQGWHPWPAPASGNPCRRGASQAQPAQPKCGGE